MKYRSDPVSALVTLKQRYSAGAHMNLEGPYSITGVHTKNRNGAKYKKETNSQGRINHKDLIE